MSFNFLLNLLIFPRQINLISLSRTGLIITTWGNWVVTECLSNIGALDSPPPRPGGSDREFFSAAASCATPSAQAHERISFSLPFPSQEELFMRNQTSVILGRHYRCRTNDDRDLAKLPSRSGRCRYSLLCCWSWRGCSECLARHPRAAKDGDVLQSLGQGETRTPLRLAFRLTSECTCVQYVSSYERMNACNSTRTTRLRRTFPHPSVLAAKASMSGPVRPVC